MSAHRPGEGAHRVFTEVPTPAEIRRTSRVITGFTWVLTGAVTAVSMSTAAPFIDAHSPGWGTGPVMAVATDGCFVLSLQSDSTLSRYGVAGGAWPRVFRWVTGLATVWLNIGAAALAKDLVGVVVHLIPPLLLLLVAEAGPAYRRSLAHLARRAGEEATPPPFDDGFAPLYTTPEPVLTGVHTLPPTGLAAPVETPSPAVPIRPQAVPVAAVSGPAAHSALTSAAVVLTPPAPTPDGAALETSAEPAEMRSVEPVSATVLTDTDPADSQALTDEPEGEDPGSDDVDADSERLSEADAAAVIEECWRLGLAQRKAAQLATRSPSFVAKVYKRLDSQHDQHDQHGQPVPAIA
ncbi:hypothetical protein [Kitasatospora camelliae]|uniref:DUF2637 domain-containing protein n=1 Tax=Kitasatospora camelliae TaxID=3156397 RepID=A0AAU8JWR2_9ACTN